MMEFIFFLPVPVKVMLHFSHSPSSTSHNHLMKTMDEFRVDDVDKMSDIALTAAFIDRSNHGEIIEKEIKLFFLSEISIYLR